MHLFTLALTFDEVDSTGCINLTAFNNNFAKLFGKTINALYAPTTYVSNENHTSFINNRNY